MNTLILDIGGTYIKYKYSDNRISKVGYFPVINDDGHEDVPNAIIKFIERFKIDEIGVSAPGPFDYESGTSHMTHKLLSLSNVSLKDIFLKRFPKAKVIFIHDAVAFMLGTSVEYSYLTNEKVACVMLGTGLGYAFMDHGRVWVNDEQVSMPELSFQKYKDGIIEDYVSATAALKFARDKGYRFRNVKEMYEAAKHDPVIEKIFYDMGKTLGEVLNERQKIDGFSLVVVGGGVSHAWELLKKGFEEVSQIKCVVVGDSVTCPINGVRLALKLGKDKIYLKK